MNEYRLLQEFKRYRQNRAKQIAGGVNDYSLINALLDVNREVELHSNFIFSMLNPKGRHYRGTQFLSLFLKQLGLADTFSDLTTVWVAKEKGKIDLMVADGQHFIIIENKLNHHDGHNQISRYIQYIMSHYGVSADDAPDRITVVYLSKGKASPAADSIKGFELVAEAPVQALSWQPKADDIIPLATLTSIMLNNGEALSLKPRTSIAYKHISYFDGMWLWVEDAINSLKNEPILSPNLIQAFEEYMLILERITPPKKWRKVMSLDTYVLAMQEPSDQDAMYQFMVESQTALNKYLGDKTYIAASDLYALRVNSDDATIEFKDFTPENCKAWFIASGDKKQWANVGFEFYKNDAKERWAFYLGHQSVYLCPIEIFNQDGSVDKEYWKSSHNIISKKALQGGSLNRLIEAIRLVSALNVNSHTEPVMNVSAHTDANGFNAC